MKRVVRIMMWEQVGQSRSKERKIKESKVRKVAAVLPAYYSLKPLKRAKKLCVQAAREEKRKSDFCFQSSLRLSDTLRKISLGSHRFPFVLKPSLSLRV